VGDFDHREIRREQTIVHRYRFLRRKPRRVLDERIRRVNGRLTVVAVVRDRRSRNRAHFVPDRNPGYIGAHLFDYAGDVIANPSGYDGVFDVSRRPPGKDGNPLNRLRTN
jgi:hypothetical protein